MTYTFVAGKYDTDVDGNLEPVIKVVIDNLTFDSAVDMAQYYGDCCHFMRIEEDKS